MKTFTIENHQLPITDRLEQAFFEYYAYYNLPTKVKCKMDPKCNLFQMYYDDWKSALVDVWNAYVDDYEDESMSKDEILDLYDLIDDVDMDQLLDQFESIFALETA